MKELKYQPGAGLPALSIHHLLEIQAQRKPDASAIRGLNRSALSFRRLLLQAEDAVKSLHVLGIGRNNRVAVILPNGPEMAVACMAVACGATCAPLNPAYRADEFDFYLSDLEAKALIVEAGTDSPARAVARQRSVPIIELSPTTENAALFTLTCGEGQVAFQDGFAEGEDVALILYTSGTTSRPKMVPLSHSNLLASATNIAAALELTDMDRCLNVMPLFHIHGLIGAVLSSLVAGSSVICTPEFSAPQFLDRLEKFHPTWYTAVPTMHQAIVARVKENHRTIGRSSLRLIRSSSAPLPPNVMADLEDLFKVPVIQAYGMTEASHQIATNPLPPRQRKAGSVGVATGTEIAIMSESGDLLPSGETGEIVIRGVNLTRGYENDSAANLSAFVNGWFRTGDLGYLDQDGYLFITGRRKEIINRGGEKVSPAEVDQVLMDHPAVAQVATFAMPHSKLGEEVAAAVVLRKNASATEREIQEFAALRLAEHKVPRRVVLVNDIPKSATGKLQRIGLAAKLGLTTYEPTDGEKPEFVAPRTLVEEILAKIWSQVLRLEPVGIHDNFFDLGGDSLLAAQVISRLRDSLQTELSFLDFFEAPTVAGMAAGIRTVGRDGRGLAIPPIDHVSRDSQLPLSFAQQRLWFFDQLEPGNPAYNRPAFLRLSGRLDTEALQRSLNEIVRRHEVLRTTFSAVDGRPYQVISPALERAMPIVDLSRWPHAERETEARRLAMEEGQRSFDLTLDSLLRARLLRLGDDEHILVLTSHHIAFDGWSDRILFLELAEIYEAFSRRQLSPLAELPIQYADFAAWQQQWLGAETLGAQLAYWRSQLAGAPPVLELPADRRRPALETFQGARQSVLLPKPLSDALKALGRQEGVTLFMTLLAAFKVLLCRYTGQEDIVIGTPVSGRNRVETEKLIGVFINTLVLRTDLSGNPSFRELLSRTRKVSLEAYAHQDLPFEKLVEDLQPERHLSRNPLFQVMFQLRNMPVEAAQLSGVKVEELDFASDVAKLDLIVEVVEKAEGLACLLTYNIDLFDAVTVIRMAGHFQTLLQSLVADPDQRISQLPLLTEAERRQLLLEWNDTKRDYPKDKCVHQMFEAWAQRTPDAVAVFFENSQLTYRELNRRANHLAHYLRKLGVGPEERVGLYMERSLETVVGVLGILKSGGVYVPLEPADPDKRTGFMLKDARLSVLLTQQRLSKRLSGSGIPVVCVDAEGEFFPAPEETPTCEVTAEHAAYVIYTSGSTGEPKGVVVTHGSLAQHCLEIQRHYGLRAEDRVLQFASLAFDVSLEQILPTLISGGSLLPRGPETWSAEEFHKNASALGLTVANLPTAYWHQWVQALVDDPALPAASDLRLMIVGGETLPPQGVKLWRQTAMKAVRLLNAYGPTETTITATAFEISPEFSRGSDLQSVLIGRPLGNRKAYILDQSGNPTPIGVSGELHLGGAGLARGYLNRPELTAEKFIPNPFSDEPGERLYKTGDLACYRPDGNIEFSGRIDHQVKIRGFRIEPGEIENVLGQHPAVRETVVLAREDAPAGKGLVGYVVPKQDRVPSTNELRSFLNDKLPEYMVPSAFVMLHALPLTPNGKLDRRALPAPDHTRPELEQGFMAPQTHVEEILAGIWSEVLGIEQIGILDNVFELGVHSLLATGVISRVRAALGVQLTLQSLLEVPTVAGLAQRIERERQAAPATSVPPLRNVSRDSHLPLSFAQQRLWFLDQLEPGYSVYNIPLALRVTGPLDVTAFERSFGEILRRHEALRTILPAINGQPVQVILPFEPIKVPLLNLQELGENEREARALQLAAEEARRSFDLVRGPLLRVNLLRLDQDEHVFLITLHHIASDGWSIGVLFRELAVIYQAFSRGQPSPLADLPIQYADFAVWQREWLQGRALDQHLTYWKQQLAGAPAMLELPTDRPRAPIQTFRGARETVVFSKSLSELLNALSRREGVTLFMTLLAAFKVLLSRYTGQCDIILGAPIAGRTDAKTEELIGFFANTLVLRTDLSGDPTFRVLLQRVRAVALEAYNHQELPFEKVVELVQPERDLSYNPLFQVLFALHNNTPSTLLELPGLIVEPMDVDSGTARFDLALDLREQPQGLNGSLEYNTDLFDAATITRMLGHFQTLLECIAADPDRRLSTLSLLTEAERQEVLVEWNGKPIHQARDSCLHELFESHVERAPDAVAVVCAGQQLTYRELNCRANQLAHYLRKLGVQAEVPVGICVERSVEMVVGLLAILKAGGAYVPLDPEYPTERLAYMLEDSQTPVLVTQQHFLARLAERHAAVVSLDADWKIIAQESRENLAVSITPENLAYVIYTSGSTGRPKGVQIRHCSVPRLLEATRSMFGFDEHDVWTVFHSYGFDFSVWEIWGALLQGGRLVVVPLDTAQSPAAFRDLLHREGVTVLNQTPSAMRQLIGETRKTLKSADELNLRLIICGGEAFPRDLASMSLKSGVPVWNFYGPTEATVWATINPITSTGSEGNSIPIGRPMADRQIYLLDRNLQPLPVGVPGELHIGGAGLARGYFKRPELTAEKFVPDPFSNEPGARLYKTGDSARYLLDGTIDFLGRIDNQVKIRGFRIELGEIEAVLVQHPAIREAVVVVGDDAVGAKRLVAYIVPDRQQTYTVNDLRSFLGEKLPDYMLPAAFVALRTLPSTPNGKVDRRALPAPDQTRPELEEAFISPRNSAEKALAAIWTELLQLERVGIHDNFFELGGHSLLATRVISRIVDTFKVELPLKSLFTAPTVVGLAERIEIERRTARGTSAPPLRHVHRVSHLPLSFTQQRLWFLDQLEPGHPVYNIPLALRLIGPLNLAALECSLSEVSRRHESLRTIFPAVNGEPIQVILPAEPLTLPLLDLQELSDDEREARVLSLATQEAKHSFNLACGPLFRVAMLRLGPEQHVLLLTMHHIVGDGWSLGVLSRELAATYEAFSHEQPSPLAELSIQYADYSVWQREWLQCDVFEQQLAYWKAQLAGAPAALDLPTDHPRPAVQSLRGTRRSFVLPKNLTEALKALGQQEQATLFMTLLAVFQTLLSRYTGQDDIVVAAPVAGRNRAEVEGLIGVFINTLVMRVDFSGNPTCRELLRRVREVALGGYAHQDLPFDKLVEELEQTRDLSRAPFSQARFVFHNGPTQVLELPGLDVNALEVDSGTAKSDWTLYMSETGQGLVGSLEYNTDLFEAATIVRVLGHFQTLLESVVANPDQRISDLSMLTEAERRQLLIEWNDTKRDYPTQCIHQRFEAQAEKTPDAIAVVFEERQLTYRKLNETANRIVFSLREKGIATGSYVPFLMDRSIEVVISMLAIMKTGAAFVPLDIHWPITRIKQILDDLNSDVILTNQTTPYGEESLGRSVLAVDEHTASGSIADLNIDLDLGEPIYAIYTSGSTGKPKAAVVPHRGIANRFLWMNEFFGRDVAAAALQTTHHVYDSAVWQLFWPLINGGKTVIPSPGMETDADYLAGLIEKNEVTITDFVPSVFNTIVPQLVSESARERLRSLRTIIVGGEEITPSTTHTFMAQFPSVRVINLYGPTEASIGCVCYEVTGKENGKIPIGRPISNVHTLILDANKNLVPLGVAGELYLSGICLGLGYLNDEEMTQAAFVENRFPEIGYDRLYKTGDLVRYLADGNVEFLGRLDHQVKIRGFRIELGEIETALRAHPAIREVVVVAHEDRLAGKRLVAYIVARHQAPASNELRSFLREKLPEYTIPSVFVLLDALPLTPNGKVDRKALPEPDQSRLEQVSSFVPPSTPVEKVIAEIWSQILKVDNVGIHDNYFDLGGHSLLATQVVSRVRQAFHVDLSLRLLFEYPTVAGLAAQIAQAQARKAVPEEITEMLADLESLSDEEAEHLLGQENPKTI